MRPSWLLPILALLVAPGCADEPPALHAQAPPAGGTFLPAELALRPPADTARRVGEYIIELRDDSRGNVWIGTIADGLVRFDGSGFRYFTEGDGFGGQGVGGIVEGDDGHIWLATWNGAWRYDGTSFRRYTAADGLASDLVGSIAKDRRGTIWLGTERGVTRFDGRTFSRLELPIDTSARDYPTGVGSPWRIWTIVEDRSGALWFGTNGSGVIRYDGSTFTRLTTRDGLADDFVFSMLETRDGVLWLGTNRGLSRYDGRTFTNYDTADGLPDHDIWSMAEDTSGVLWLGTGGGGASRFDGRSFVTLSSAQGLANRHVQSLLADRRGRLWLGTSGGLFRLDGAGAVHVTRD